MTEENHENEAPATGSTPNPAETAKPEASPSAEPSVADTSAADASAADASAAEASAADAGARDAGATDAGATDAEATPEGAAAETAGDAPPTAAEASEATSGEVEAKPDAAASEGGAPAKSDAPAGGGEAAKDEAKAAGSEQAQAGEAKDGAEGGKKKKKKRKRKKKKKGEGEKKQAFTHLFEGTPRAHAFRVGEIIAGRVEKVADGAIVVDLFGKATAVADVNEPREIPEPEPEPKTAAPAEGAGEASATPAATDAANETAAGAGAEAAPITTEAADGDAAAPKAAEVESAPAEAAETTAAPDAQPVDAPAAQAPAPAEAATEAAAPSEPAATEAAAPSAAVATEAAAPSEAVATEAAAPSEAATTEAATTDASEAPTPAEPSPPPEPPTVGSIFRGRVGAVAESGHIAIVNRLIDRPAAKATIFAARDAKERVEGVVYGYNRGGFDVLVEGIRAFCPAGGMAIENVDDPSVFVGKKLEFTVPPSKGKGKSIIVTRRGILERELRKAARARLKELEVGQRIQGAVTEVRDYGLLVDLGQGLEGLAHQSELSYKRGVKPSEIAKVGDELTVEVLKVQPATRRDRTGRVSLSLRKCLPDPWEQHADAVKVGAVHKGKVTGTTDFGAFVEIAPEIEGLLHISELGGDKHLKHASEAVSEGDELDVLVERVDKGQRRISLAKLTPEELEAIQKGEIDPTVAPKSLKPGSHVTIVIDRVEHHGCMAHVKGVIGKRGRAYLPNRELPDGSGDRKKSFAQGKEVQAKIVGKDRSGALRVSVKGRQIDEERKAVREYRKEAAKQGGFGTFGDLLRSKLDGDDSSPSS